MPIITKKDKLSISMTWSSADDKNEVDISIQRDGDEDVTVTLQSGKSSVVVGASCVKELYDFLVDRGIIEPPNPPAIPGASFGIPALVPGVPTCGGQEASDDIVGLLAEAKRWNDTDAATRRNISHSSAPALLSDSVYASPSLIAATGSAVVVQTREASSVSPIARNPPVKIDLPNESSDPDGEEVIEMDDVPSDIFGR
jgi:hypothetical protein